MKPFQILTGRGDRSHPGYRAEQEAGRGEVWSPGFGVPDTVLPSHSVPSSINGDTLLSAIVGPLSVAGGRDIGLRVPMRRPPCPVLPQAKLKATCQPGRRKLQAWGRQPSPMSLLGSGTALPGCRASSLHQQIASIPFLQELPRAPRKGEKQMGGAAKATVVPGGCSQNKHMGLS